jgi:phosphoketolase
MATSKKITPEQAMEDLSKRKHVVDESKASAMVKKYKTFRTRLASSKKNGGALPANIPDLPTFITYNKKAFQALMKKTECVGVRIYPAINDDNGLTFVIVGVDAAGENILSGMVEATGQAMMKTTTTTTKPGTVDEGQTSPPYPAPSNGL